jgi:hemolysin III
MKKREPIPFQKGYTVKEEIANSLIHGFGILFGVGGLTALLILACLYGSSSHFVSYLIYGISLLTLYTFSTLYHAIAHLPAKKIFKTCDHAAIYLLIAGTYTPFMVLNVPRDTSLTFLTIIWSMAFLGILFKFFFTGRFKLFSTSIYLGMGWMIVGAMGSLRASLSSTAIAWIFAGGITYTVGTVFYLWKKLPYNHAIWHLFVLLASIFHFIAILYASNLHIHA